MANDNGNMANANGNKGHIFYVFRLIRVFARGSLPRQFEPWQLSALAALNPGSFKLWQP